MVKTIENQCIIFLTSKRIPTIFADLPLNRHQSYKQLDLPLLFPPPSNHPNQSKHANYRKVQRYKLQLALIAGVFKLKSVINQFKCHIMMHPINLKRRALLLPLGKLYNSLLSYPLRFPYLSPQQFWRSVPKSLRFEQLL